MGELAVSRAFGDSEFKSQRRENGPWGAMAPPLRYVVRKHSIPGKFLSFKGRKVPLHVFDLC